MTEKFTINRKMTSGLRPWLAALFCVAALTACKNKDGFTAYDAATEIAKLDLAEAQPFTIDVNVRATGQDSCLSVFLADDFVHFGETEPCVTVPITGESFQISISLKRMRAARIRGVDATGNLTETSADLWLVPGETIKADAFSKQLHFYFSESKTYNDKVNQGVEALRKATRYQSPYLPVIEGKRWENVSYIKDENTEMPVLVIKEVIFGKEATVLRLLPPDDSHTMSFAKGSYLSDDKGRKYLMLEPIFGNLLEDKNLEVRVFGGYVAYDPVPDDVETLTYHDSGQPRLYRIKNAD